MGLRWRGRLGEYVRGVLFRVTLDLAKATWSSGANHLKTKKLNVIPW